MLLRLLANNTNKQWEIEGFNYISLALFVALFASFDIIFFAPEICHELLKLRILFRIR